MADLVAAVDQGTTSTRFMIFDHAGNDLGRHQLEHQQILPRPGWVEHNPVEIWERTQTVIQTVLYEHRLTVTDLAASGSPTSGRPPWCGTAGPVGPTTTPLCGRTPGPTGSPPP